jgi:hypothetical protein
MDLLSPIASIWHQRFGRVHNVVSRDRPRKRGAARDDAAIHRETAMPNDFGDDHRRAQQVLEALGDAYRADGWNEPGHDGRGAAPIPP